MSSTTEGICWTRTAERQASRMRMEYLKSVLRQEVGFFDTQTGGTSTTYQVVSLISSDANTIQVVLCEKVFPQLCISHTCLEFNDDHNHISPKVKLVHNKCISDILL